jgi:LDH2 family malate/lactate/ureidoglycolate dehydrogenase
MQKRFPIAQLRNQVVDLAHAVGVSKEDAVLFAEALIDADLHGTSTHGMSRLPIYLKRIEKGLIDPKAQLQVDRSTGSALALDARNGLGQVQATKAVDMLIPLARQNGVAAATVRRSQHFGALSYYCNRAAAQNCILLAMTTSEPAMSPEGGSDAFFGTNPIACSFPTGKGYPIKVDLATSKVARGNIIAASKQNASIPEDWAFDVHGHSTTDPHKALLGTVATMAGHKGYALALMVEMFSSVLSGAAIGPDIGSMYKNLDRAQDVGHFFLVLDIGAFMPRDQFIGRVDSTIDRLKSGRKRPGTDEILIPGERAWRTAKNNSELGIPVSDETLTELEHWCAQLHVWFAINPIQCRDTCPTS